MADPDTVAGSPFAALVTGQDNVGFQHVDIGFSAQDPQHQFSQVLVAGIVDGEWIEQIGPSK